MSIKKVGQADLKIKRSKHEMKKSIGSVTEKIKKVNKKF